jgi:hypothetical protein
MRVRSFDVISLSRCERFHLTIHDSLPLLSPRDLIRLLSLRFLSAVSERASMARNAASQAAFVRRCKAVGRTHSEVAMGARWRQRTQLVSGDNVNGMQSQPFNATMQLMQPPVAQA